MSKVKQIVFAGLVVAIISVFMILPACTPAEKEVVTEVITETVIETVTETVTVVEEAAGGYAYYETLRASAIANEAYPDAPAAGHTLAFTNIMGGIPFCEDVWQNVQDQWVLAGGSPDDLYYADNQYDATIGLKNADIMLAKSPDVLINFQFDAKINSIISTKFSAAGIPIIAVDVPTPMAPFMGVNNFYVSYLGGQYAVEAVKEMGGIEMIDAIVLMQFPAGGEVLMLRSEGFYQAFVDEFGAEVIDPITYRADGGAGEAEQANKAMTDILSTIPDAEVVVMTSINEQTMSGCIAAIQTAGRWDPEKWFIVTMGCDNAGKQQVRDGLTDGAVAFFPERYGEYLIPAAVSFMNDQLVPPFLYVDNVVINSDNIDEWYAE